MSPPKRKGPGRGPHPLLPQPWRSDSSPAATINAVPIVARSPFRLLPGRGPRPLVPNPPWRYHVHNANASIDSLSSFSSEFSSEFLSPNVQDDQTSSITVAVGAEPIAARSPFRLLPGRGPRPLVPQPWRYYVQNANATITATQDDQTVAATAAVSAEPIAVRSPFRLLPGKGPRPLVPQPWRYYVPLANAAVTATQDDQAATIAATNLDHATIVSAQDDQTLTATATVSAEPVAARSPFRLLPGRGPRPLVPQPWRYYVPLANVTIVQTQDDQTASVTTTNLDHVTIVQTQDDHRASITGTVFDTTVIVQTQADQTISSAATNLNQATIVQTQADQTSSITATIGAEPIAVRSPFRLLPGRGPRPLVPQPWRWDFSTLAGHNAVINQTQDDQAVTAAATNLDHISIVQTQADQTISSKATIAAEPVATRSPFRLLPGRGPRPLVPQPWRYYVHNANASIDSLSSFSSEFSSEFLSPNVQDDQTAAITASIGAVPIATRSPFRLLPGRGPRPLVPNPWRHVVQADLHGSIVQTQDDQTISAVASQAHVIDIDQNQDDHTISSTAALLAAAAIAQTQSSQTIVSAATNRDHAAIVQTQDDQTIVTTALRLLPRTAAIVQTQQDQTIHMAAGQPRAVVAQPQFLW